MEKERKKLIRKQKKLLKELASIDAWIEGTLTTTYSICGKKSCRCMKEGKKHPAMFFTWKENKKSKSLYVPVAKHEEAVNLNKNYKKMKEITKQVSDIQKLLLKT